MIAGAPQTDRDKQRKAEIREQRRYEIARDVMAALWVDGPHWGQWTAEEAVEKHLAVSAVKSADALLAKLEE
jgi:hypothetical protein